jgi:hypothetical protein
MPAITSAAVREILAAAGHAEWVRGEVTGFHLGEGDAEVLIERLRGPDAGEPYTDDVKTAERTELNRYCGTLREAGYEPDRAWRTHGYRLIVLAKAIVG